MFSDFAIIHNDNDPFMFSFNLSSQSLLNTDTDMCSLVFELYARDMESFVTDLSQVTVTDINGRRIT